MIKYLMWRWNKSKFGIISFSVMSFLLLSIILDFAGAKDIGFKVFCFTIAGLGIAIVSYFMSSVRKDIQEFKKETKSW